MLDDIKKKQLEDLINEAEANGEDSDFIQNTLISGFKNKYDTPQSSASPEQTPYEKHGIIGAAFPAATSAADRGGNFLSRAVAGAGDVITTIPRGIAAMATGAGTLAGGGSLSDAGRAAINEFSKNKSDEKGALGFVQNVGYDPATYIPAGKVLQGAKFLSKAPTLLKAAVKTGIEGATQGAASSVYQQAEKGKIDVGETATQAGIGAGLGAITSGVPGLAAKGAGKFLQNSAKRNVNIELRPGQFGANRGFDAENVIKNELVGKPREVAQKSEVLLKDLNAQAKVIGAQSSETVNPVNIVSELKKGYNRKEDVHNYDKVQAFLTELEETYKKAYPEGDITLSDAMKLRTQVGDKAAFVGARDRGGMVADPDADWKEEIFNDIYGKLKDEIHSKGGEELKAINKLQSQIIPVRQVALRRIPISESNNRIGLGDMLTTGIGQHLVTGAIGAGIGAATPGDRLKNSAEGLAVGMGLAGIRRAVGSKAATNAMYKLGSKLNPSIKIPPKPITPEVHTLRTTPPDFQKALSGSNRLTLPAGKDRLSLPDNSPKQIEPPGKYSGTEPGFTMPGGRESERALRYRQNRLRTPPPDFQKALSGSNRLTLPAGKDRLSLPDNSPKQIEPPGKYSGTEPGFTMPGIVLPSKSIPGSRGKTLNTGKDYLPRESERALRYRQNRLSPEQADIEAMDAATAGGYAGQQTDFIANQEKVIRALKNKIVGGMDEINYSKLTVDKRKNIDDLVRAIETNPDVRQKFVENGLMGSEDNIHRDVVIDWFNSVSRKRK
jgi:hypothetical protein